MIDSSGAIDAESRFGEMMMMLNAEIGLLASPSVPSSHAGLRYFFVMLRTVGCDELKANPREPAGAR